MSMNEQMQEAFAMFYGMSQSLADMAEPVEMAPEERVKRAKAVFAKKLDADIAIELESCIHCGLCADACHYYRGTGDSKYTPIRKPELLKRFYRRELSPMRWLHRLYTRDISADDLIEWQELVYDSCTECGRCSLICPMGIHIAEMVAINREALAEAGLIPAELLFMQQGQAAKGTIFDANVELLEHKIKETSERLGFQIPVDRKDAEILVLTSGLDLFLFSDALAGTAKALHHLGVKWSFCTEAYEGANFGLLSGHEDTQHRLASKIINLATECGAKVVITPECGHAFPSLRWAGAESVGHPLSFDVMSVSEYLGRQVMDGKLKLEKEKEQKVVTLHDPCKIGRMGGAFDEGRALVEAMGLELRETESNRQYNFCCGGGAGNFLLARSADLRHKAYEVKMDEVRNTGAEALVVSCGSCRLNFEVGKFKAHDTVEIDSLAALVGDHLPDQSRESA